MTYTLEVSGWRKGLKKVSLTELLRDDVTGSLKEAKGMTDRLLDGEVLTVSFESLEKRDRFRMAAEALGVVCRCADAPSDGALGR